MGNCCRCSAGLGVSRSRGSDASETEPVYRSAEAALRRHCCRVGLWRRGFGFAARPRRKTRVRSRTGPRNSDRGLPRALSRSQERSPCSRRRCRYGDRHGVVRCPDRRGYARCGRQRPWRRLIGQCGCFAATRRTSFCRRCLAGTDRAGRDARRRLQARRALVAAGFRSARFRDDQVQGAGEGGANAWS